MMILSIKLLSIMSRFRINFDSSSNVVVKKKTRDVQRFVRLKVKVKMTVFEFAKRYKVNALIKREHGITM